MKKIWIRLGENESPTYRVFLGKTRPREERQNLLFTSNQTFRPLQAARRNSANMEAIFSVLIPSEGFFSRLNNWLITRVCFLLFQTNLSEMWTSETICTFSIVIIPQFAASRYSFKVIVQSYISQSPKFNACW